MQITLIFAWIISFMLFTVLLLLMYFILKNFWFTIHVGSWYQWYTRCTWAGGMQESSALCYLLCYSRLCTLFGRISDSQFMMSIHKSVGLVPFSAQYPVGTCGWTDSKTDELIQVGLGNLRLPQVYLGLYQNPNWRVLLRISNHLISLLGGCVCMPTY